MGEIGSISVTGLGTRAGNRATIVLDIDIPENCHIEAHEPAEPFLIPTVVEVDGLHEVEIDHPRPGRKEIIPGAELLVYNDRIQVEVRGQVIDGAHTIRGRIRYQSCVGGVCLPPRTDNWSASLQELRRSPSLDGFATCANKLRTKCPASAGVALAPSYPGSGSRAGPARPIGDVIASDCRASAFLCINRACQTSSRRRENALTGSGVRGRY